MKYALPLLFLLSACASSEEQVTRAIKNNPQILFRAIEDHPEEFMASVQRAAQVAQARRAEQQNDLARKQIESDRKNPKKPAISEDRRLSGKKDAPVTIIEFGDFQCPACGMAYESLAEVKKRDGDRVQFYFKHMPLDFHPQAEPAARFFEGVRKIAPAKAMAAYDELFSGQAKLRDPAFLKDVAKRLGLKYEAIEKAGRTKEVTDLINADRAEFEKFGFTGTPVIIVNGISLNGAQPPEEIERVMNLK